MSEELTKDEKRNGLETMLLLAFIKNKLENEGTIYCPNCGKKIFWYKLGKHKHVHAKCETEHCFNFLE